MVGGAFQSSAAHTILMRYTVGMTDVPSQAILIDPQGYYNHQINMEPCTKVLCVKWRSVVEAVPKGGKIEMIQRGFYDGNKPL